MDGVEVWDDGGSCATMREMLKGVDSLGTYVNYLISHGHFCLVPVFL